MELKESIMFGIFTDLHYSHRNNDGTRFFSNAITKLNQCYSVFKDKKVDFVACLGDLTDYEQDKTMQCSSNQHTLLYELEAVINSTSIPFYLCLGNHDLSNIHLNQLLKLSSKINRQGYYSYDFKGFHFVVLNTNYGANDVLYTQESIEWDNLYICEAELRWLERDLRETNSPTIVLTHGNIDYREVNGYIDPHVVRNYHAVQRILVESGKVRLVLQGHCHSGAVSIQDDIPYITLKALVDECYRAVFMLVTCTKNLITLSIQDASSKKELISYEVIKGNITVVKN